MADEINRPGAFFCTIDHTSSHKSRAPRLLRPPGDIRQMSRREFLISCTAGRGGLAAQVSLRSRGGEGGGLTAGVFLSAGTPPPKGAPNPPTSIGFGGRLLRQPDSGSLDHPTERKRGCTWLSDFHPSRRCFAFSPCLVGLFTATACASPISVLLRSLDHPRPRPPLRHTCGRGHFRD